MQQLENELAQTQTNLETASHNLEEKEKALQNVCSDNSETVAACAASSLLLLLTAPPDEDL